MAPALDRLGERPETVGTHPRNAYRKLEIRSRGELAGALAADAVAVALVKPLEAAVSVLLKLPLAGAV